MTEDNFLFEELVTQAISEESTSATFCVTIDIMSIANQKVVDMSETTYALDRDLREAEAMAQGLLSYLQQDRLYGSVGSGGLFGGGSMPSLTIGALLMRLRRLQALSDSLTDAQREQLRRVVAAHDFVRKEWTLRYTDRLLQEATSRLKAMDVFFEECEDNPRTCARNYMPETLRRTIVRQHLSTPR